MFPPIAQLHFSVYKQHTTHNSSIRSDEGLETSALETPNGGQFTLSTQLIEPNYPVLAELAERSPIIKQNSSNPSSRKNLDVRPCKVLLLTCVANCTAGTPTPRLCPVVQWSVHWAPSRTTRVLVLAGARRWEKKMRAPLLGLAKFIY